MRRLTLALCYLSALAASAAPVPKGKSAFESSEWKKTDHFKDCKFVFDAKGGAVTFKVPGSPKARSLARGGVTVPRLMRPAGKGDFDVQVRLRARFAPGRTSVGFGQVFAGLFVLDHGKAEGDFDRYFAPLFGAHEDAGGIEARASTSNLGPGGGHSHNVEKPPYRTVKGKDGKEVWEGCSN
jgi:hypothetical protein